MNTVEQQRTAMDLDVAMRSLDCPYTVHFYGAMFRDGDVWICMEVPNIVATYIAHYQIEGDGHVSRPAIQESEGSGKFCIGVRTCTGLDPYSIFTHKRFNLQKPLQ